MINESNVRLIRIEALKRYYFAFAGNYNQEEFKKNINKQNQKNNV